jgi:uncharacterized protein (DUF433 family)
VTEPVPENSNEARSRAVHVIDAREVATIEPFEHRASQVAKLDPRLAPIYSIADAARYLKIPSPTVRSWVAGHNYPRRGGKARSRPVISTSGDPSRLLSFRNLIELAALRALRTEHEFKLSAVREALDYARKQLNVSDLLASRALYAKPGQLFLERYGSLINLNRAGQLGIKAVLDGLLQRIEWDKNLPTRFFPALPNRGDARTVQIDPRIRFGRPTIARLGVSTEVIVDRVNAGESLESVAEDYGATRDEILDALAYERAA